MGVPIVRSVVGLVCLGVVGCSVGVDGPPSLSRGGSPSAPPPVAVGEGPGAAPESAAPMEVACPTGVTIADDLRVSSVQLVGDAVYYRAESRVLRVDVDGGARSELYASTALRGVHGDATSFFTVERTDAVTGTATLRRFSAAGDLTWTTAQPTWLAVATTLFASDDTHLFVRTETTNGRETLYAVAKTNGAATELTPPSPETDALGLTNPQLANQELWFVRGKSRVFKLPAELDPTTGLRKAFGTAREVFGSEYFACQLGVGVKYAVCSDGKSVQRRDLTGANPSTVLEAAPAGELGVTTLTGNTLFIRSSTPSVSSLRMVDLATPGAPARAVACASRGKIVDVAVDAKRAVWADEGGVHMAPR